MTKSEIRSHNKALRNGLSNELMNIYNKKIRERLFALDEFINCTMLFTYISFGKEVNTHDIINKAFQMNKRVFVPRVENNECHASQDTLMLDKEGHALQDTLLLNKKNYQEMNFYEIKSLDNLVRSNFGILEPIGGNYQKYVSSNLDKKYKLMLLPGLAFDIKGNRIGYGAGHYDRYLSKFSYDEWNKIALAYDFQIIDKLTVDIYDIPADYILTPDKFIVCKG